MRTAKAAPYPIVFAAALGLAFGLAGCATAPTKVPFHPPETVVTPPKRPRIVFTQSTPPTAEVLLDSRLVGTLQGLQQSGGLEVEAGIHRIEVRLQGYRPFRAELAVKARGERLRVVLHPRKVCPGPGACP